MFIVRVRVSVIVNSFSVFLRAQKYSLLTVRYRNHTLYFTGLILYHTAGSGSYWICVFVRRCVSVFSR